MKVAYVDFISEQDDSLRISTAEIYITGKSLSIYASITVDAPEKMKKLLTINEKYSPSMITAVIYALDITAPYLPIGTVWTDSGGRLNFYPKTPANGIRFYINGSWIIN